MNYCSQVCMLAKQAGEIMKQRPNEIVQKSNESDFVTDCDRRVQQFLEEGLQNIYACPVLGEEGKKHLFNGADLWIVDPIDGTSNFIRNLGASVISIALMIQNELVLGVIYNPYRDEIYYAEKGCGAFCNQTPIHVSDRDFRHAMFCSAMSLYDKRFAKPCLNIIGQVYQEADDLRRFGSAAFECAQLSAGRVELFFEMRISPWDVAAGAVLIKEAGGICECLHQTSFPADHMFPFLAANTKENFERLREIVVSEVPEMPYDVPLL